MAWLTSLLNKPETIDDASRLSAKDAPSANDNGAQPPPAAGGPPLAILAPDIAGISSFRLRFFADAATAAAEIEKLPPQMRHGTHAFWALHDEPVVPPDGHREALVLIRANLTSGVVYTVSFVDMESAQSFARFEVKRGLDVSHLLILWAAFATVREELDGITVLPAAAAAPATRAQHARAFPSRSTVEREAVETVREYERGEGSTISDGAAPLEAPENEAKLAEAEAERRAEAFRRAEAEEAARIARQAQDELREARAAADAARALAEAEVTRRQEAERRLEEQQQATEAAARSSAFADLAFGIESALTMPEDTAEEPVVLDATGLALEALPEVRTQATSYANEETLTGNALDDVDEPLAHGTVFAHAPAAETEEDTETVDIPEYLRADGSGDPADDLPKGPELDEFDIAYEVARLLENRRWDKREEPFHGFDSPPGRF